MKDGRIVQNGRPEPANLIVLKYGNLEFAHELFVVFGRKHPQVQLIPYNTGKDVQRMIYHVTSRKSGS